MDRCSMRGVSALGVAVAAGWMMTAASAVEAAPLLRKLALSACTGELKPEKDAKDFHLTIESKDGKPFKVLGAPLDGNQPNAYVGPNDGTKSKVTAVWLGDFKAGKRYPYGALDQKDAANYTLKPMVTFDGKLPADAVPNPRAGDDPPADPPQALAMLGWRIEDNGDVYALNGWESSIDFSNMLFSYGATTDLLSQEFALLDTPTGVPGLSSAGTVPAAVGSTPGELLVGNFPLPDFTVMSAVANVKFSDPLFSPLEQTQACGVFSLPTPGAASLLACASLAALRRRRR